MIFENLFVLNIYIEVLSFSLGHPISLWYVTNFGNPSLLFTWNFFHRPSNLVYILVLVRKVNQFAFSFVNKSMFTQRTVFIGFSLIIMNMNSNRWNKIGALPKY